MNHKFHPEARHEYLEQVLYYEERRRGLGANFVFEVDRAVERICAHPQRHRIEVSPDIRSLALNRFPIRVIYTVADGVVQVLALAHTRRTSMYWATRTADGLDR